MLGFRHILTLVRMKKIVKEAHLIYVEVGENSNKEYRLYLYDDDSVSSVNGRVGITSVPNELPKLRGLAGFEKQLKSKLKKGYTEVKKVQGTSGGTIEVKNDSLEQIAKQQIKLEKPKPELEKLIERLVKANIHRITHSTQITFNDTTGLFQTPLGVVTLEAITEARDLLAKIKPFVAARDYARPELSSLTSHYLRLIPQNVGMKLQLESLFPDDQSLIKQSDTLDALESSYKAFQKTPTTNNSTKQTIEKVFDVNLDLIEDNAELERINKFYRSTANGNQVSYRLKIVRVYSLRIGAMAEAFNERGRKVGNIMELWHGTKKCNLCSILKGGLKCSPPSTAAIAGKMFSNGIYFSDQSTKSLNYAYGYWDGKYEKDCFMLLNEVAMGRYYVPPGPDSNLPKPGYDSTFAKARQSGVSNNEMVIYDDRQCNITHLVEFSE